MKLLAVFPVHNQHSIAQTAIDCAIHNLSGETDTDILVIDNGSKPTFLLTQINQENVTVRALGKNYGVYPLFWIGLKDAQEKDADVVAFFHSDLMIAEKDWDKRLIAAFEMEDDLGLVGFVGSNEIDAAGGRGLGTCSNFQGNTYTNQDSGGKQCMWVGSTAEVHGRRVTGVEYSAVVDGCAMVFRRSVLEQIPERKDFPPHHFYDRLLSCEVRERGYKVITMGIGCDHISGQTVNQEQGYQDMARAWAEAHGIGLGGRHNWDQVVYEAAGTMWLSEYRDQKRLVPCKV